MQSVIPSHFKNPTGLAMRLLRTGDPAAMFAMKSAALAALAMPVDWLLAFAERRLYRRSGARTRPLVFVCGPPRSGTTVVAQSLIDQLDVAYFANITSVFPRAPLTATRMLGYARAKPASSLESYYGKSRGFAGPNDALYLWDRWLGVDRTRVPTRLSDRATCDLQTFFAACEEVWSVPLLNKCNGLNASAHLVAEALNNSYFICMRRAPIDLAQSLYRARLDIHGDLALEYGLADPQAIGAGRTNPVRSVCDQVRYFERLARSQQRRIGGDRFWVVDYESFCARPQDLAERVRREIPGVVARPNASALTPLTVSTGMRVDIDVFETLRRELTDDESGGVAA